jgi:hypothetical protein
MKERPAKLGKKEAQRKILNELAKRQGTFEELKEWTGLSRSTLWSHLRDLGDQIERVYDSENKKLLIRFSKVALEPKEVFLRELDNICAEPLSPESLNRVRQALTEQVLSRIIETFDRLRALDVELTKRSGFYKGFDRKGFESYKVLAGLWIYQTERDRLEYKHERWRVYSLIRNKNKKKSMMVPPEVKKEGLEKNFDSLVSELGKVSFTPAVQLLHHEIETRYEECLIGLQDPSLVKKFVKPAKLEKSVLDPF